jgi:hypothetical protein
MLFHANPPIDPIHPALKRCPSPEMVVVLIEKQPAQCIRKRKTVSFLNIVTIKAHDHFKDMTPEEIDAAWYKRRYYHKMKENCIPALSLIMRGVYPGDCDELCRRGLEYRTVEGSTRRKRNKLIALRAVMIAQQKFQGCDEAIRTEYVKVSASQRLDALRIGHDDSEEAAIIYDHDRQQTFMDYEEHDIIMADLDCFHLMREDSTREVDDEPDLFEEATTSRPEQGRRSPLRNVFHNRRHS